MDTSRVDVVYRPLRIAWAIRAGDFQAYRRIAKLSCTLAGGRYNPIVIIDAPEAVRIVESFRADVIKPVSEGPETRAFADQFPHLIDPWFGSGNLHYDKGGARGGGCHVLDIHNLIARWYQDREWCDLAKVGLRRYIWEEADPLADVFLAGLGALPLTAEVHTDYLTLLNNAVHPEQVVDFVIAPDVPIPEQVTKHPGFAVMGRFGVRRYELSTPHYWNHPGFYTGRADDLEDLVAFWNLRAADIPLHFIDRRHPERYTTLLPIQQEVMKQHVASRAAFDQHVAVWARSHQADQGDEAKRIVGGARPLICTLSEHSWNGMNIKPPTMMLGNASTLGVVINKQTREATTFALADRPFSSDFEFYTQKLVASVSMFRSGRDQGATFQLPYVPELNERFGRLTEVGYAELRVEPERIGIIINASADDATVYAVSTLELVEVLFKMIGLKATLSNAGLITRQLITQMGGLDSTRAFKISGVRRLIRTSGLNKSLRRNEAIELIGKRDPETGASFSDHKRLFVEARAFQSELQPSDVFSHLVEKRIFRVGADLLCPTCRLSSWLPIDDIKQQVACPYCGANVDTPRHFSVEPLTFRRSGLLGIEKNMQGAIPVILVLQQLMNNVFSGAFRGGAVYMPSLNVEALDGSWPKSQEIDFFAIELTPCESTSRGRCTRVIIGEAKDHGSSIDANDAETMRRVAAAFPRERFEVFIVLAKLTAFTNDEITVAAVLARYYKIILLTDQELEPYYIYDRADEALKYSRHDLDALAQGTRLQYPTLYTPSKTPHVGVETGEEAEDGRQKS